jgi:hypothetical protein
VNFKAVEVCKITKNNARYDIGDDRKSCLLGCGAGLLGEYVPNFHNVVAKNSLQKNRVFYRSVGGYRTEWMMSQWRG